MWTGKPKSSFRGVFAIQNHLIGKLGSSTNTGLSLYMELSYLILTSHIYTRNFSVPEPLSTGIITMIFLSLLIVILTGRQAKQQQENCHKDCADGKPSLRQVG